MAHKPMRRCSMSPGIRKTQIKTTVRHHLIATRIATIIFKKIVGGTRRWRHWNTAVGNVKRWSRVGVPQQLTHRVTA